MRKCCCGILDGEGDAGRRLAAVRRRRVRAQLRDRARRRSGRAGAGRGDRQLSRGDPARASGVPRQLRRHLPRRRLSVRPCRNPAGGRARRAGAGRLALDPRAVPRAPRRHGFDGGPRPYHQRGGRGTRQPDRDRYRRLSHRRADRAGAGGRPSAGILQAREPTRHWTGQASPIASWSLDDLLSARLGCMSDSEERCSDGSIDDGSSLRAWQCWRWPRRCAGCADKRGGPDPL